MSSTKTKNYSKVSWIVFIFTISIVLISLIPVIFPSLFSDIFFKTEAEEIGIYTVQPVKPFELGNLAIPLIVANIIVFIFFYLLKKKKQFHLKIESIIRFQIPKKITIIIIIVMITAYVSISYTEVGFGKYHAEIDEEYLDWLRLKNRIINMENLWPEQASIEPHFKHTLLKISQIIFGNFYVVPYFSSIGLLIVTYLFTTKITNNRTAGLISLFIVLQSSMFLRFDTSASYNSFWILLYLLSLYAIVKSWQLSPVFYVLSIFSKIITIAYAPMSIFFILNSNITKRTKIIITSFIISILVAALVVASTQNFIDTNWQWDEFWLGFTAFAFQMRLDGLIILFLLPLTIGLFIISKNNKYANSILILIVGILLLSPIISALSHTNQPYRYLSLVVFFAVGVGLLFSKIRTK